MNNPLAFPRPAVFHPDGEFFEEGQNGMSLRDYFAGQALHGLVTSHGLWEGSPTGASETAYKFADAMLKEREK